MRLISVRYSILLLVLLITMFMVSSCNRASFGEIESDFSNAVSGFGGKSIIFKPLVGGECPREVIVLFGRDGVPPDELSLIKHAQIWYSERPSGGDAAVFYAVNATDTPSIAKMCERRARTLKYSAGIEAEIFTRGHFVVFINCQGEYAGIREAIVREFEG